MDFHSMIGKLRAIESLGVTKNYVAEEEATNEDSKCAMTAEGESCPVHGLSECPMVPMEEADEAVLKGLLKNSGQMGEATGGGQAAAAMSNPPTAQDSGETWSDWFGRVFGGSPATQGAQLGSGGQVPTGNLTPAQQYNDPTAGLENNITYDAMGNVTGWDTAPAGDSSTASTPGTDTTKPKGTVAGGDARMGAASTGKLPADTSGGVTSNPTYRPKTATPPSTTSTARPEGPARGMPAAPKTATSTPTPAAPTPAASTPTAPQSYDNLPFGKAFAAARKEAGGAGGSFMWKGKPYQTNVKGEKALPWNSPELKKVGGGWSTTETIDRIMELSGLRDSDDIQDMADTAKVDDMSTDMSIEDLMRKYGVDDKVSEDAPLVGAPFTPLGATNNGPEEWGMVVTGGTDVNHFEESITFNSNMDVRDGKVTKSLSISATDEDVDRLAAMLRNAGIGDQVSFVKHEDICDGCGRPVEDCMCNTHTSDCGCGAPDGECQCGMALENADHDYGNEEKSPGGEPVDAEEYIWDGPHLNQRFGKIGDNTLMAERAIAIFKNYSKEYSQVLAEADLEPSNAGFDSPLTANNRDEFDKDPFVGDEIVDDGSHSPLSTVKRQDVMN